MDLCSPSPAGLENLFVLTSRRRNELRVDVGDWEGDDSFASYSSFSIDPENAAYQLHLGTFKGGDAGAVSSFFLLLNNF